MKSICKHCGLEFNDKHIPSEELLEKHMSLYPDHTSLKDLPKHMQYHIRLQNKSVAELKAIYTRRFGSDLLRGTKCEMINCLAQSLDYPRQWKEIVYG